jgi:hypothetical protein
MTTIRAFIVAACCGLIVFAAVTAHAGESLNGLSLNGLSLNGLSLNGLSLNGLSLNGLSLNGLSMNGLSMNGWSNGLAINATTLQQEPRPAGVQENLSLNGLGQRALGRPQP